VRRPVCPRTVCGNRGDLLSRFGILATLRRLGAPDVTTFCRRPGDISPLGFTTLPYGRLYNLLPPPAGWRALWRGDVVLWTGGLDLQDDSSLLKLVHTWLTFLSYRLLGLRIVAVMQGAGPLATRLGRWWARRVLNLVDLFLARDGGTQRLLEGLGVRPRVVRAADGIFLPGVEEAAVSGAERAAVRRLTARRAGQPLIGLNLRLWFHFRSSLLPYQFARRRYARRAGAAMDRLVAAAVDLARRLRRRPGARVLLLSMYEPGVHPWEDDLPHLARVKAALADDPDVVLVDEPLGLGAFCRLVGGLDLMIGSRLHATLTALRFGVPAVNLAYTAKCYDIFADLGLAANAVPLEAFMARPAGVAALAERLLQDEAVRPALRRLVAERVAENQRTLQEALGLAPPARAARSA
jgi:polysaccharide pyruvyl transferase WcaK-like protein